MALIEWSEKFRTGLPRVDQQHQEIFRLIRRVTEFEKGTIEPDSVANILRFLVEYVTNHFGDEELFMRAAQYPDILEHQSQHQAMTRKISEMYRSFIDGRPEMGPETAQFLGEWLTQHIIKTDLPFVQWVKSRWGDISKLNPPPR